MPLNFSPNLSTMFTDLSLPRRFQRARDLGFSAVEILDPYSEPPNVLNAALQGLQCDLINMDPGPTRYGCAAVPLRNDEFNHSLEQVKIYHSALNFKKLHILSGEREDHISTEEHIGTFVNSLSMLGKTDFLENFNAIGLIEPICAEVNEDYFLNSYEIAVDVLKQVDSERIKLLLDIYHLHHITGNVRRYLEVYYPYAGHIQVSQDPGRTEPFCAGGNIDYTYVFDFLRQRGHTDFIGLEYTPSDPTDESFEWIQRYSA